MKANKLWIILLAIFLVTDIFAQDRLATRPLLNLIFPSQHDTVSYSFIRISGSTRPGAKLNINGEATRIYSSGAFVNRVALKPKDNKIILFAADSLGDTTAVLNIFRTPLIPVSPESPTEIDPAIMWPEQDMTLISGEFLEVRFKGSPGGQAKFSVKNLCKNIPMTELPAEDAQGMKGIYHGVVKLKTDKYRTAKEVKFELRGIDGKKVKREAAGKVTVLPDDIPLIGETVQTAYLKTTPYTLSVMSILPAGVKLQLTANRGHHYKVKLSEEKYAYVSARDVRMLPPGRPLPKTTISLPAISFDRDWIQLNMRVNMPCPFTIKQTVDPATLELTVFGAHLSSQWITYPAHDSTIKMIRWEQPSADIFKLFVDLNQKQQWGHRVLYENNRLILKIRKAPQIADPPESPLAGLIFTLDAGHGGAHLGAVGPTGLMEKDVNLIYTKKLAALLDSAGAQVVLTRDADSTMSLAERIEIAREANSHFFLWLHNNSVGATSDAAAVRGTSTYFTVPQNQKLAWTLYPHLLDIGLVPFGRVQSDYFVTRRTDMLIVLVEGAFMSHPEDEMLMMDDRFLDQLARAVFNGLEEFCAAQR